VHLVSCAFHNVIVTQYGAMENERTATAVLLSILPPFATRHNHRQLRVPKVSRAVDRCSNTTSAMRRRNNCDKTLREQSGFGKQPVPSRPDTTRHLMVELMTPVNVINATTHIQQVHRIVVVIVIAIIVISQTSSRRGGLL
jgi:hypothetical protein